jgi:hypothetical protein
MRASLPRPSCIALLIAVFLSSGCIAAAQSTIATVPSTDAVAQKDVYLEFDFISHYVWFGGRNRFGYVTPGLSFATTQRSLLYTGYSIGNQGRRNNAFFTYYGITF